jgi:hypothetical protein
VSGESTENPQDPGEDAATVAPGREAALPADTHAVDAFDVPAPETVATPDAEAAIEGFEVPPPPKFSATPPPSSPEPVIPPATSDAAAVDATEFPTRRTRDTWMPNDTWTSASAHKQGAVPPTAAQKAESRAAASRAATARDEATRSYVSPAAGGTAGQSYRGWTIAIYTGLAVLLFGAIAVMVVLGPPI